MRKRGRCKIICQKNPHNLLDTTSQVFLHPCVGSVGPCEVVLLKKALPCLLCLLCLEEKGQRQQLKSHLIPENLS